MNPLAARTEPDTTTIFRTRRAALAELRWPCSRPTGHRSSCRARARATGLAGSSALPAQGQGASIYLHMNGGPAQMDLWDYKPKLAEYFDKDLPESIRHGQRITTMTSVQKRLPVSPRCSSSPNTAPAARG